MLDTEMTMPEKTMPMAYALCLFSKVEKKGCFPDFYWVDVSLRPKTPVLKVPISPSRFGQEEFITKLTVAQMRT